MALTFLHFLIPQSRRKKDLIIFPHNATGDNLYKTRFGFLDKFLVKDGLSFEICNTYDTKYVIRSLRGMPLDQHKYFHKLIWKRISQVLKARNYKAAFVQRNLFPDYWGLETPYLEKLLRKLNNNITLDFWDAVYVKQPVLVSRVIKYADKLSLVNKYLYDHFPGFKEKRYIYPIAVDINRYNRKQDYEFKKIVRIIWTGTEDAMKDLPLTADVFKKLAAEFKICLVVIAPKTVLLEGIDIDHHLWDKTTFFNLLAESDIAINPRIDSEYNRGKVALKVLEYMASGLPVVTSPIGITPHAVDRYNVLFAEKSDGWERALRELISDKNLRKKLGENARQTIVDKHNIEDNYIFFKKMVFEQVKKS